MFSKKIKKQYNCELIVDDILNHTSPDRFEKLNKLCKTIFVSTIKLDKKYNTFLFRKYMNCALDKNITNNLIFYLFLFFKTFYCSFKIGSNLFPLISRLILFYLKYETVFRSINSKFLIPVPSSPGLNIGRPLLCNRTRHGQFQHGLVCLHRPLLPRARATR